MSTTEVRRGTKDDLSRIAEIKVASWRAAYKGIVPDSYLEKLSVDDTITQFTNSFNRTDTQHWVAELNGQVASWGYVGKCRDKDVDENTAEIYAIYTDPNEMSKGLGAALVEAINQSMRSQGHSSLILWVVQDNIKAIHFYKRVGFAKDGSVKQLVLDGVEINVIRMWRRLS